MLIKCFGLFWRTDEVDWNPGTGRAGHVAVAGVCTRLYSDRGEAPDVASPCTEMDGVV